MPIGLHYPGNENTQRLAAPSRGRKKADLITIVQNGVQFGRFVVDGNGRYQPIFYTQLMYEMNGRCARLKLYVKWMVRCPTRF